MKIRLLLAVRNQACADLLLSMLDAALHLVPLEVTVSQVDSRQALLEHVVQRSDDVVFIDWDLTGEDTPDLVYEITHINPMIRVVALLPLQLRQYRQRLWEAGACSSVPKEHMDQEWLSSVLCLMHRAMCREARILSAPSARET
jgi:DNA-binding NarL/FixJ family response regulator